MICGICGTGIADHAVPLRRFQNGACTDAGIRGDHSCVVQFLNSYKLDSAGTGPAAARDGKNEEGFGRGGMVDDTKRKEAL